MTKGQAHVQTGKAVKSRVKVDPHFRTLRALAQDVRLGLSIHVCALGGAFLISRKVGGQGLPGLWEGGESKKQKTKNTGGASPPNASP